MTVKFRSAALFALSAVTGLPPATILSAGGTDRWYCTDGQGRSVAGAWRLVTDAPAPTWTSTARSENPVYLVGTFPYTRQVLRVALRIQCPSPGTYGPIFGFSHGLPDHWTRRAVEFRMEGTGWLRRRDIGSWFTWKSRYTWLNLVPIPTGESAEVMLTVDPTIGACQVEVTDPKGTRQVSIAPFLHPLPYLDGFFISNEGTPGRRIAVTLLRLEQNPIPSAPKRLRVRPLSFARVQVTWKPSESGDPLRYVIYRNGTAAAAVPAGVCEWTDREAGAWSDGGRKGLRYFVVAETKEGCSLPSWSSACLLVPPYQSLARAMPLDRHGNYPIVVFGATPAGLSAALTAARLGHQVALVEPTDHIGGMMTGGLSATDRRHRQASGGLFKEFLGRVETFYRSAYGENSPEAMAASNGYYFEPRIATQIWTQMLFQSGRVHLYLKQRLIAVEMEGRRVRSLLLRDGKRGLVWRLAGKVFIDASYEGDVAAKAGCIYRLGREGRDEYGEEFAGETFWDSEKTDRRPEERITFGSSEGDTKVQAYNFRLTLTHRADNRVAVSAPPDYRPDFYEEIAERVGQGLVWHPLEVVSLVRLPGHKWDANNTPGPFPSTDYIGANYDYPEADEGDRWRIKEEHRRYIQGLLYYLQTGRELPSWFRSAGRFWSLATDEFESTGNFPPQLYVREARRIIGDYVFREKDARPTGEGKRAPVHCDSIAVAEYPIDSHTCTPRDPSRPAIHEGFFYLPGITSPSHLPYRILLPRREDGREGTEPVDRLLVCGAVSATHVAFGTIRLEPVWMALGQASGVAAHLALTTCAQGDLRRVDIGLLQKTLLDQGQVIAFFEDLPPLDSPYFAPVQYFAVRGFFPTYWARVDDVLTAQQVSEILDRFVQSTEAPSFPPFEPSSQPPAMKDLDRWLARLLKRESLTFADEPDQPITVGRLFRFLYELVWLAPKQRL